MELLGSYKLFPNFGSVLLRFLGSIINDCKKCTVPYVSWAEFLICMAQPGQLYPGKFWYGGKNYTAPSG